MTAPTTGFVHEAGLYAGEAGLLPLIVPFVEAGLAAGERAVIALSSSHAEMARAVLPDMPEITFLPGGYPRPTERVTALLDVLRAHAHASPSRMRIVGELAVESLSRSVWSPWVRYEAAANHLYAPFNATAMCAYDTTTTPAGVLADVAATHPCLATADRTRSNERYRDPAAFLGSRPVPPDPIEATPPITELSDPDPATARRAIRDAAVGCVIGHDDVEDLVLGASEVIANANLHGRPPVLLRIWAERDRLVALVSDSGDGPANPFAGLAPDEAADAGGRGLWITHQICGQVDHITNDDGFAVRLATSPPGG